MSKSINEEAFQQRNEALAQQILRVIVESDPPLTINQAVGLLDYTKGYMLDFSRPAPMGDKGAA
jgi:hypothetical protein